VKSCLAMRLTIDDCSSYLRLHLELPPARSLARSLSSLDLRTDETCSWSNSRILHAHPSSATIARTLTICAATILSRHILSSIRASFSSSLPTIVSLPSKPGAGAKGTLLCAYPILASIGRGRAPCFALSSRPPAPQCPEELWTPLLLCISEVTRECRSRPSLWLDGCILHHLHVEERQDFDRGTQ
jgi:hypothetical protein